ncbi:MAG TPA: VOC family protein [Candidatus Saccharimonadales bacterium]|nr:VOC family protein [Candidatus Saccharimonadales bacterium]
MLGNHDIGVALAVKDLEKAKQFYSEVLGLQIEKEIPEGGGIYYKSGNSYALVYPSSFAGTNQATYAGWTVDNIDEVVKELKDKGVAFEHYPDFPGVTLEGDVHSWNGQGKTAWFKDPDGNILAINEM